MYTPDRELVEIGFKEREIKKIHAFYSAVMPVFQEHFSSKLDRIVDLCSGNGLCSFIFQCNDTAEETLLVDVKITQHFKRLRQLFKKYQFKSDFIQEDINSQDFNLDFSNKREEAIVSVHPCSELGDKVIDLGLKYRVPFALMTCCHKRAESAFRYSLKNPPDTRLLLYSEPSDYFDLRRQRHIEEQGMHCLLKEIPDSITKKNHILVGIPKRI